MGQPWLDCPMGPIAPTYEGLLVSAEAPADGRAVFRHPVAAELKEVVDPVSVDLGTNEDVLRDIDPNTGFKMNLEVIRAFNVLIGARAAGEIVTIRAGVVELHIYAAESSLELRNNSFEAAKGGCPNAIKVIESRTIIQSGITALREAEIRLAADSEMRSDHDVGAEFSEGASQFGGVIECAVAKGVDGLTIRACRGGTDTEENIRPDLCIYTACT